MRQIQSLMSLTSRCIINIAHDRPQLRLKSDGFDVKRFDEDKFGGWKSAKVLLSEVEGGEQQSSVVGRWDWHFWQLLLALIPGCTVYALAKYAERDMARNADKLGIIQSEEAAASSSIEAQADKTQAQLETRLSALETAIQEVQRSLQPPAKSNAQLNEKPISASSVEDKLPVPDVTTGSEVKAPVEEKSVKG